MMMMTVMKMWMVVVIVAAELLPEVKSNRQKNDSLEKRNCGAQRLDPVFKVIASKRAFFVN